MAKIPKRQVQEGAGPLVQSTAQLGTLQTPDIAGGLTNIAVKGANIYTKERDHIESVELDSYNRRLTEKYNELMHDKDTGFRTLKGRQPSDNIDDVQKQYNDFIVEEEKKFGTDRLRQLSKKISETKQIEFEKGVNIHSAAEYGNYEKQEFAANIEQTKNDAVLNYESYGLSGDKAGENIAKQNNLIARYGKRQGMSSKQIKTAQLGAASDIHDGIVRQALGDDKLAFAKNHFESAKDKGQMTPETSRALSDLLDKANSERTSQVLADQIISENLSLGDSLKAVRDRAPSEERDETLRRVKNQLNEKKAIEKDELNSKFNTLVKELEQNKTLDHMSVEHKAEVSAKRRKVLNSIQSILSTGHKVPTDPVVYQDVMEMASDPRRRKEFLDYEILDVAHKLKESDRNMFIKMQNDIRSGKADKHLDFFGRFQTNTAVTKQALDEFGVTNKEKRSTFFRIVEDQANKWEVAHGKKITNNELREITDSLLVDVENTSDFRFSDPKLFELAPGEEIRHIDVDDVPEMRKNQIIQSLEKNGIEVNDKNIEDAFLIFVKRNLK